MTFHFNLNRSPVRLHKFKTMWHFLPELPEVNVEVLVAVKYDDIPVQAYWNGKEWKGSRAVRDNMSDGFVRDESYKHIQEWIYAWHELPAIPPIPEPF